MVKQVNASHILVDKEKKAKEIHERINGGEIFEDMAKKYSNCPSGKKGGSLGWFKEGAMVKEFDKAAFGGQEGTVIGPIHTQFGWHLIKINGKK